MACRGVQADGGQMVARGGEAASFVMVELLALCIIFACMSTSNSAAPIECAWTRASSGWGRWQGRGGSRGLGPPTSSPRRCASGTSGGRRCASGTSGEEEGGPRCRGPSRAGRRLARALGHFVQFTTYIIYISGAHSAEDQFTVDYVNIAYDLPTAIYLTIVLLYPIRHTRPYVYGGLPYLIMHAKPHPTGIYTSGAHSAEDQFTIDYVTIAFDLPTAIYLTIVPLYPIKHTRPYVYGGLPYLVMHATPYPTSIYTSGAHPAEDQFTDDYVTIAFDLPTAICASFTFLFFFGRGRNWQR